MNPMEQTLISLVQARSAALVAGDAATMERILHPDFVYINSEGAKANRAAYLATFVPAEGGAKWQKQDLSEIEVRFYGDTALVTCCLHDVATWGDYVLDGHFRATYVYIQTPQGWQCVSGQTTGIVEAEG